MRIAFYSDTYLPAVDGVVTSMLSFKKELENRGHKVFIFASGTLKNKNKYESSSVFIHTGIKFKPYPQYSMAMFPYHSILKLSKLRIDLIHAQTPFTLGFNGLLAAKLGKYPLVGSFHTLFNNASLQTYYPKNKNMRRFYKKYLWKYVKFFYRRCDVVIAPSNTIKGMLERHKIGNVVVVPNGIDTRLFNEKADPTPALRRFGLSKGKKRVLYLGRISKEKNLDTLLLAAASIAKKRDDVEFVVGGTGPLLSKYMRMASKLGISASVRFLGFVDQGLLPSLYAASDVLCMPSKFETQGIVCLEAMSAGKPVVAANTPVLKEFISSGKSGEHFSDSYISCARVMERVLNNAGAYKKGAISTARMFSIEKVTDRLEKVYEEALDKAIY
ncbi:MAG: glycosyltransferase [Candidatus Micrarchaeaceae archaeon]